MREAPAERSGGQSVARKPGDDVAEHAGIDGLEQEGVEPGGEAPRALPLIGLTRYHHRSWWPCRPTDGGPNAAHQPTPVLVGHDEVAHHHVWARAVEGGETLLGSGRRLDGCPRGHEQAPECSKAGGVVVHDEDAHTGELARRWRRFVRHRLRPGVSAAGALPSTRTNHIPHIIRVSANEVSRTGVGDDKFLVGDDKSAGNRFRSLDGRATAPG